MEVEARGRRGGVINWRSRRGGGGRGGMRSNWGYGGKEEVLREDGIVEHQRSELHK